MYEDDLIPLKRVLEHVGVSRVTLWRALNSGLNMPKPSIVRRRVFWKVWEIQALDQALDGYRGRVAFEEHRRQDRLLSDLQTRVAAQKPPRKLRLAGRANAAQLELFTVGHRAE